MGVGGASFYYGKKFIVLFGIHNYVQDREKNSLRNQLVSLDRDNIYGEKQYYCLFLINTLISILYFKNIEEQINNIEVANNNPQIKWRTYSKQLIHSHPQSTHCRTFHYQHTSGYHK